MTTRQREVAIIGLGNIGGNIALQALRKGQRVVGNDRRPPDRELVDAGIEYVQDLSRLSDVLTVAPRVVFMYVPAGPIVDTIIDQLLGYLTQGDVIVDGGNSYWGDSMRRHERVVAAGLRYVDLGTSGGLEGARNGACFMVGGARDTVALVEPILRTLAVEGGYVHAGGPGAGHFAKLVHNGIEFGMLQAIGEGVDLLESYHEDLPVADILKAWSNGSVIRSWLIELLEQQYREQDGMSRIPGYIEDTGEVNWLVDDALQMDVPIPVIAQAVMQLLVSRDDERKWARAVAMMRHGFGNHPFGAEPRFASNRQTSRVGSFVRKK